MKSFLFFCIALLILTGCSDSSSHTDQNNTQDTITTLFAGESAMVYEGDKLLPESTDTYIRVVHNIDDNTKTVNILSGSATLLRGEYILE